VLILTRADVEGLLDPLALLDAVSVSFQALSAGVVEAPPRQAVAADGGSVLTMAGRASGAPVAVKLVGVFPGNVALGLEPHPAVICLLDPTTGVCLALMDGEHITGLRTAAGAALSTRALARGDASVLAIVGAGVQARTHLALLPLVREFTEVRIVARDPAAAQRLIAEHETSGAASPHPAGSPPAAASPAAARGRPRLVAAAGAGDADVICLTTSSSVPVLALADVAPGTHVTSVGFAPPGGELDPALAAAARLCVETRQAFSPPPAGCAELAGLDPAAAVELGELLSGRAGGRASPQEITVYKAMGHIAEDAAAAELVYRTALERGVGRTVDL
jgi:ornithine cyclodeaminase/alanine dehydrogenase-like protein (mu-crystallin family)